MLSGDQIKKFEIGWTCGMYGEKKRDSYGVFVGKREGKRSLGNVGLDSSIILK